MLDIRQSSLAGGEISPNLYQRIDLAQYLNSLRRCRNCIITKHGAAVNRPGTRFVAEVKDSSKKVRLIPFNFADGQNFVLEFGDQYIRFFQNGGRVMSGPAPYEIATTYLESELSRLKYAQVGDIITICHPAHAPSELRRLGNTNWTLAPIDFSLPAHSFTAVALEYDISKAISGGTKGYEFALTRLMKHTATGRIVETTPFKLTGGAGLRDPTFAPLWNAGTTYNQGDVVRASDGYLYIYNHPVGSFGDDPASGSNPSKWPRMTAGSFYFDETIAPTAFAHGAPLGAQFSLSEHKPKITWSDVAAPAGWTFVGVRLYQGIGKYMGLIYDGDTTPRQFVVDGTIGPDFTYSPPTGVNPFQTDFPAVVVGHDQRRVLANTGLRPAGVLMSKKGDLYTFDPGSFAEDDDPIDITLSAAGFEEVRWAVSLRVLLLGTNRTAPWSVSGADGKGVLSPSSIVPRAQNQFGASWLDPLVIGSTVLATQEMDNIVREILFSQDSDGYQSADISVLADHLFEYNSIVRWAYAQVPHSVVWSARDDGLLLGLTHFKEHQINSWHWHDTQGLFEDACTVQEGKEHAVYTVVVRTINGQDKRYIERFASRRLPRKIGEDGELEPDVARSVFLDSSLTYDGPPVTTVSGLGHLEGRSVMLLIDGNVAGPLTVEGGALDLSKVAPDGAQVVTAGLSYVSEIETLDAVLADSKEVKSKIKRVLAVNFEVRETRGLKVGADFEHMHEAFRKKISDGYGPPAPVSGPARVLVASKYEQGGRACISQDQPLPMTVLSIMREVDLEDD